MVVKPQKVFESLDRLESENSIRTSESVLSCIVLLAVIYCSVVWVIQIFVLFSIIDFFRIACTPIAREVDKFCQLS